MHLKEIKSTALLGIYIAAVLYIIYRNIFVIAFERTMAGPVNALIFILIILYIARLKFKNKVYNVTPLLTWGSLCLLGAWILVPGAIKVFPLPITLYPLPSTTVSLLFETASLILCITGILLLLSGTQYIHAVLIPGLLLVAVPRILEHFLIQYSYTLQLLTTFLTSIIFKILSVPVIMDDVDLYLPHIQLTVDASCNGINHLIALIVLAFILISAGHKSFKSNIILISSAILLGLVLNAVRISLIGIWALFFSGDYLHGPANFFYVAFIFTIGSMILIWIWSRLEPQPITKNVFKKDEPAVVDKNLLIKSRIIIVTLLLVGLVISRLSA